MSSMVLKPLLAALLIGASSAAIGQGIERPVFLPGASQSGSVQGAIATWRRLRDARGGSFPEYASFLIANPGWPNAEAMRRAAERAIGESDSPAQIAGFFARYPALTTTGEARHALALSSLGRRDEARAAAARAWRSGSLTPQDEARLPGLGGLTSADHDARMERLLWDAATASAARQLGLTSPGKRALFEARLALQTRSSDASLKLAELSDADRNDPGLIVDRAGYLRKTGSAAAARQLLAGPRRLTKPPLDAQEWLETLLTNARGAAGDGQWPLVYDIARQIDDAYAPGVDVSERPLAERDDYTSLAWLGGTTALKRRGRPADAIGLFDRYGRAARSPQTQSKGFYWAGRAAQAAGRAGEATAFFQRAARFKDQFYGQLARERLGPAGPRDIATAPMPTGPARDAFNARSVVRAARALSSPQEWRDQTQFLRAIAQDAKTGGDHYFAAQLSREIRRPDLGVIIGRSAEVNGLLDPLNVSFPITTVPSGYDYDFTMIHAITRQESQFDRMALSSAGARGLMQLMPGTARETAGKIGESYSLGALTDDPLYNIRLGSSYFQSMLRYYGGSYPLAVAAYNAGPGNVNRFIRANGDPRLPGVDMVDWIEAIPIQETRNYVQRVLENAVVYDAIRPDRARTRGSAAPLSWYLGKRSAG